MNRLHLVLVLITCVIKCESQIGALQYMQTNWLIGPDDDPEAYLNTAQIVRRHGYPAESHIVQTSDGYLLTLHRIPGNRHGVRGRKPVFLQHGLLSSSIDWVNSRNHSLAFTLADRGYDVWLGNARGNVYSRGHVTLLPSQAEFWNFSWHEMAVHDIPANILYICKRTKYCNRDMGEGVEYVGHSMGTTMFFAFASRQPHIASRVRSMVALAPVAYMSHIRSPIRYLAPYSNNIEWLLKVLGVHEFLPNSKILKFLARDCQILHLNDAICRNIIFILCGFDKEEFDSSLLPVILRQIPAGTSTKTVIHYAQEIHNDGDFRQFDYGEKGNMAIYGTPVPPEYKLENIAVPVYLMYGDNDYLASPIDVKRLSTKLPNLAGIYEVPMAKFNHIDFIWGKHAVELVYEPLIKFLSRNETIYDK